MSVTAKLFMSGRSQAIRLPAKLRIDAKEVRIEQVGNALWIQPDTSPQRPLSWLKTFYATSDPLPDTYLADRHDAPPQIRDWT
ncbi:MAG: AbrB/MazE/SpoVT family DNA-binding domain-containing protein [Rhodoferax sp.]|nr:AbrB/MazE/SpoVT family DNA-binding domain-containing protein [Rhodoferax sp.]